MGAVALSTGQQGVAPIPGVDMMAIMTYTPTSSATAGTNVTGLDTYFSTIDAIAVAGMSTQEIGAYVPVFEFTPGATATSSSVKIFFYEQDGDAGPLVPDDGTDLSSTGTIQVIVYGKAASGN